MSIIKDTSLAARPRCRPLDPDKASAMLAAISKRAPEFLTTNYGISYNTLRKIEAGEPIRVSLAARIESRVDGDHRSHAEMSD